MAGINESGQSLIFAGDVPTGSYAQLMSGNLERLVEGAAQSARQTISSVEASGASLALAVSCVGRRGVFRERIGEELEAVLEVLGPDATLVGSTSGEISPHLSGPAMFHNQTMTLTTLAEA